MSTGKIKKKELSKMLEKATVTAVHCGGQVKDAKM